VNAATTPPRRPAPAQAPAGLRVLAAGPATTVQDLGRPGRAQQGVARSGAADPVSLRRANRIVGNQPDAAALEVTVGGLVVEALGDVVIGIAGATVPVSVRVPAGQPGAGRPVDVGLHVAVGLPSGAVLSLGTATRGLRSYVAVRGGVAVDPVLGSRSTDTLGGIGPAPVGGGDVLPAGDAVDRGEGGEICWEQMPVPPLAAEPVLRVVAGWRTDWFGEEAPRQLASTVWTVSTSSSRTGLRLDGARLPRRSGDLPSEPMVVGALQVPPSGEPILLGPDSGTTGGYPVLAVVRRADLWLAGQLAPGDRLRFRLA
jgi:biotin-dependent carboxylase-like uncharacterized protein